MGDTHTVNDNEHILDAHIVRNLGHKLVDEHSLTTVNHAVDTILQQSKHTLNYALRLLQEQRSGDDNTLAIGHREDIVDNIVDLIATNLLARLWREGAANTCVEELQIVIYFGCCTYRRAGVARDDLLLDSNGWGDTLDKVDIGLFDTAKKLTGIRREALDIAALTLGKDGVEGKG